MEESFVANLGTLVLFRGPLRESSFTGLLVIRRQSYKYSISKDVGATVVVWERRNSSVKATRNCRWCCMGILSCI